MEGEKEEKKKSKIRFITEDAEVFETEDLPEDDQELHKEFNDDVQNIDGIEQPRLDIREAFKSFVDKKIDCLKTDFSDSIAGNKKGYLTSKKEDTQTLAQKHARLREKVQHLKEEVSLLKSEETDNSSELMAKVECLASQLDSGLRGVSVADAVKVDHARGNVNGRRLIYDLNAFLTTSNSSSSTPQQPQPPSESTNYEISCNNKNNLDSLLLKGLEQRVSRCETVVGKLNSIALTSSENHNKSILGALSLVVARFSLLDLSQLAHFESSLLAIHQKVLHASAKSDASDIADKIDKLEGVYERVKKWDSLANAIPYMLDRLVVMKDWHLQATQFSKVLRQIGGGQKDLSDVLQDQSDHLKQIQVLQAPQLKLFEDNCSHIEALIN